MSKTEDALIKEKELLSSVANKGTGAKLKTYSKLCGPGWLQSAITLGGGSLIGALSLGAIGGSKFMWVQPLAMILGIIMLSAIAYVTLSTGQRPFKAINNHVSPVLGWGWLGATMLANMVWCLPQFNLAYGAIAQNLIPQLPDAGKEGSLPWILVVSFCVLSIATFVVFSYGKGNKGILLFEKTLKIFVGLIVLSFIGVILKMSLSKDSLVSWSAILGGLIPDFGALFKPSENFQRVIEGLKELNPEKAAEWTNTIVSKQRDSIITAFGTAVGINMTFLLPYSMLRRKWGKEHRGLAVFDLSTGLFIPFVIATGCLVIATATQFHANPDNYVFSKSNSIVETAKAQFGDKAYSELKDNKEDTLKSIYIAMPKEKKANAKLELMTARPSQLELATSLEPLTGKIISQWVFGFGVLAMAVSTVVILMLINGFAICEAFDRPDDEKLRRIGCLIAGGIGFFGPIAWGKLSAYLVIPTSVFGFTLLPIAYITFLLLMNSKSLLGDKRPEGIAKLKWNILMTIATLVATLGAGWASYAKIGLYGPGLIVTFGVMALIFRSNPVKNEV
ncbi:MAG TPA: hypothetical protein EYG40_05735 [Verrucomicrobia bacterium]|nr:hypothetical protein [Verrucomicrobiales bacterium]HIL54520.1 hypothetical protein [Verrucomicrobiota bacterium]